MAPPYMKFTDLKSKFKKCNNTSDLVSKSLENNRDYFIYIHILGENFGNKSNLNELGECFQN